MQPRWSTAGDGGGPKVAVGAEAVGILVELVAGQRLVGGEGQAEQLFRQVGGDSESDPAVALAASGGL